MTTQIKGNWDGLLDEVRISNIARSAAWIKFEYRNMAETDNELIWSAEEEVPEASPPSELIGNPYMFTGRAFDLETGLYYYRARYYNPYIGRLLQTDPIGYGNGMNWYSYCRNNPVNFLDPMGLYWFVYDNSLTDSQESLFIGAFLSAILTVDERLDEVNSLLNMHPDPCCPIRIALEDLKHRLSRIHNDANSWFKTVTIKAADLGTNIIDATKPGVYSYFTITFNTNPNCNAFENFDQMGSSVFHELSHIGYYGTQGGTVAPTGGNNSKSWEICSWFELLYTGNVKDHPYLKELKCTCKTNKNP